MRGQVTPQARTRGSVLRGQVTPQARTRGGIAAYLGESALAEYPAESASEGDSLIDFDDFVHRFDLEGIVRRYMAGARRAMMERTLSIRLED